MATEALVALRDQPFELLLGLEEAILGEGSSARRAHANLWVGVAFRLGRYHLICSRTEIREVIIWPGVSRIPRAKPWLMGLANVRGQLLPLTNMARWAGLGDSVVSRSSRIIVVNHPEIPAGLLVDQVVGFRRFTSDDAAGAQPTTMPETLTPFLLGGYERDNETWAVLSLRDLVESEAFLQAAS
jgi:twitching motility protein PilI